MRLFIAEDEAPARERLVASLARVVPHARIAGSAGSVREAAGWLAAHPAPDLLLLDIQLADGLSLELFDADGPARACPVIFTTAYDEFALAAFRAHAVDYLLKPIDEARLAAAFDKHASLRTHFTGGLEGLLRSFAQPAAPVFRTRLLGRKGTQWTALAVDELASIVSIDKLAFALTRDGTRHLVDGTLAELERELDPARFFRANRQTIVNVAAVAGFRSVGKGRLVVETRHGGPGIDVSPERAQAFRDWLAR